jgi:hypothetical protein
VGKCGRTRQATDDNIIRRLRIACRIPKATDAHSERVILIAFLLQQWALERASMLRLQLSCLSCNISNSGECLMGNVTTMTF